MEKSNKIGMVERISLLGMLGNLHQCQVLLSGGFGILVHDDLSQFE